MSDDEHYDDAHMDAESTTPTDFFDHDPCRAEKLEVSYSMWNQGNGGIASSLLLLLLDGILPLVEICMQNQRTIPFSWFVLPERWVDRRTLLLLNRQLGCHVNVVDQILRHHESKKTRLETLLRLEPAAAENDFLHFASNLWKRKQVLDLSFF